MRVLAIIFGVLAAILVSVAILLNTSFTQNWLLKQATDMLEEKLNTRVTVDSVSMNLFTQDLTLYGIQVDDLKQRQLISLQQLSVDLELSKLFHREVVVKEARMTGLDTHLVSARKSEDGVSNYQFLIDAFKKEPKEEQAVGDSTKKHLEFDVQSLRLKSIHINYDDTELMLGEARYTGDELMVDSLRLKTDNHRPRKNAGRPNHGYFDVGHLNVVMNMRCSIHCLQKDSLSCTLTQCNARDSLTGIDFTDLRLSLEMNKERVAVSKMVLQQANTVLNVPKAVIHLPSKTKESSSLYYSADSITGRTLLKDISRPFAPALKHFVIPLNLSLNLSGTDSTMSFSHVKVSTDDRKLTIAASGGINHLKDKHRLAVRFRVSRMNAKSGIAAKIISQFSVKKYMMKQLHRLGNISYTGSFAVLWRREEFQGRLGTAGGPINFRFALNESSKYINGTVSSSLFQLGHIMEMDHLGPVACQANFTFDYSKARTAMMRRKKGGKLPMGSISAHVDDCSYRKIHIRNLSVNMKSDGAEAVGDIRQEGKYRDLYTSFSFTNTDEMHKMRLFKPGIKFHKARRKKD